MKLDPNTAEEFAIRFALARDLPLPLPFYAVWCSRSRLFELQAEGILELHPFNGHACLRPSDFERLVNEGLIRIEKATFRNRAASRAAGK